MLNKELRLYHLNTDLSKNATELKMSKREIY